MENISKVSVEREKIDILSDSISEFICNIQNKSGLEGVFIVPCVDCKEVNKMFVEFVIDDWLTGLSIEEVSKKDLELASNDTGIEIKVENIWYSYYNENNDVDSYDMPLKGMLKSGTIIYDVNGNLSKKQKQYREDKSIVGLGSRGVVQVEPPIQYRKK